jgi:flagellin
MRVNSNVAVNNFRNNTQNNMQRSGERLAGGKRINRASDDAAGLGISEGMTALIRSLSRATDNARDMGSALRTAEGGLTGIVDNLQRMRELTLQASNGIMTQDDRRRIQNEISQSIEQIDRATTDTQFNTMNMLDGSFTNKHMASNPGGGGMQISIADSGIAALGSATLSIEDIDVVNGNTFDNIQAIDEALAQVAGSRSELGATQNRIDYITTANTQYSNDISASRSRMADADMALEAMLFEQERILEQYQIASMNMQMNRERDRLAFVGMMP